MIEKQVEQLLNPLVGNRVYFEAAPQKVQMPYIILQQVGGNPLEFLGGPSGSDFVRLQIDVWADKRTTANEIMSSVRELMAGIQASPVGAPISMYEPAIDARRRSCDFRILAPA